MTTLSGLEEEMLLDCPLVILETVQSGFSMFFLHFANYPPSPNLKLPNWISWHFPRLSAPTSWNRNLSHLLDLALEIAQFCRVSAATYLEKVLSLASGWHQQQPRLLGFQSSSFKTTTDGAEHPQTSGFVFRKHGSSLQVYTGIPQNINQQETSESVHHINHISKKNKRMLPLPLLPLFLSNEKNRKEPARWSF